MKRTCSLLLATAAGVAVANAADLKTYGNSLSTHTWTWTKTEADRPSAGAPITYNHSGTLATGLGTDNGGSGATLKLRSGPARIDNGLPELPPEPYASGSGTSYAYPVPTGYTGAFGLYNGDVSAYAAAAFPGAMSIYSGTYTQAQVDSYLAGGGWTNSTPAEEAAMFSRFDLKVTEFEEGARYISFQLRIQGMGPSEANVANGTYITSFDAVSQILPLTLTVNGVEVVDLYSREMLSYADLGVGSRHGYAPGGQEEVWEFIWDLADVDVDIDDIEISFTNYPTAVITGIEVNQLSSVPEPSTYALLLGLGVAAVAVIRRRRQVA